MPRIVRIGTDASSRSSDDEYVSFVVRRTNTFAVRPRSEADKQLLCDLIGASVSLWNELTYAWREQYFAGASIWATTDYWKRYVGVLGSATAQQVIPKISEASRMILEAETERAFRPMARPVRRTCDNYQWRFTRDAPRRRNSNEERTNRSTHVDVENLASVDA